MKKKREMSKRNKEKNCYSILLLKCSRFTKSESSTEANYVLAFAFIKKITNSIKRKIIIKRNKRFFYLVCLKHNNRLTRDVLQQSANEMAQFNQLYLIQEKRREEFPVINKSFSVVTATDGKRNDRKIDLLHLFE